MGVVCGRARPAFPLAQRRQPMCDDLKKWEYKCLLASGVMFTGPAEVALITVASDGTGQADAIIYDGVTTSGVKKIVIRAPTHVTRPIPFHPPTYWRQGMYVDFGANTECVTVHFKEDSKG